MSTSATNTLSLMHVDDDENDQFLFTYCIGQLPISLTAAASGFEALERLTEAAKLPDIILLDIRMPRMSGLELLEKLKATHRFSSIPVVMFSNSMQPEDVERARQLGATGYCVKPADVEEYRRFAKEIYEGWLRSEPLCIWPVEF